MFNIIMSAEKITTIDNTNLPPLTTLEKNEKVSSSGRVDINDLLARARKVKEKENKINFIFFGLFAVLILVAGILLSF